MRALNPRLLGMFVRGAPCVIVQNTHPGLGVANGSYGELHSLTWDPAEVDLEALAREITAAAPGETVHVAVAPAYVNVWLPHARVDASGATVNPHQPIPQDQLYSQRPSDLADMSLWEFIAATTVDPPRI